MRRQIARASHKRHKNEEELPFGVSPKLMKKAMKYSWVIFVLLGVVLFLVYLQFSPYIWSWLYPETVRFIILHASDIFRNNLWSPNLTFCFLQNNGQHRFVGVFLVVPVQTAGMHFDLIIDKINIFAESDLQALDSAYVRLAVSLRC